MTFDGVPIAMPTGYRLIFKELSIRLSVASESLLFTR